MKDLNKCVHLTMGQSPPSEFYNERGKGSRFIKASETTVFAFHLAGFTALLKDGLPNPKMCFFPCALQ